jgi:hypothetical protein
LSRHLRAVMATSRSCFFDECRTGNHISCDNSPVAGPLQKVVFLQDTVSAPTDEETQPASYRKGDWVFAICDDNLWPGSVEEIQGDQYQISFFIPQGSSTRASKFKQSDKMDTALLQASDLYCAGPHTISSLVAGSYGLFCSRYFLLQ